jgi:hypothetical protein
MMTCLSELLKHNIKKYLNISAQCLQNVVTDLKAIVKALFHIYKAKDSAL